MADKIAIREYEEIYSGASTTRSDKVYLSQKAFDNLYNSIIDINNDDRIGRVFSIRSKNRALLIKASKYVGVIQTADGTTIEILPKIYSFPISTVGVSGASVCGLEESKLVFLNMLRHFKDENGISFDSASLDAKSEFPILEAYIQLYLTELTKLLRKGLQKGYIQTEEVSAFLRGKLIIQKQAIRECTDKTKFEIRHDSYLLDTPQNRLIVSTLSKLKTLSKAQSNIQIIKELQAEMDQVPLSANIPSDLQAAKSLNRLHTDYKKLLEWSSLFLTNQGLVTFSGRHINQSFLFPVDKLFESFIAYLAKKYLSDDYYVTAQDHRHFLIDDHAGKPMFNLRPDIYLERKLPTRIDLPEQVIIDTKWKRIDQNKVKGYDLDQDDLYQMFAYGKKYERNGSIPKMVLLYPYCDTFLTSLSTFTYDLTIHGDGLKVIASSFNIADKNNYESMLRMLLRHVANC